MKQFRVLLFIWIAITAFPVFGANPGPVLSEVPPGTLQQALDSISEKSGVRFQVSDSVADTVFNSRVTGDNWNTAIRRALTNFNVVEVTDAEGNLKKVFVLGRKDGVVEPETVSAVSPATQKRPLTVDGIWLTSGKLREIAKGPFRGPLPENLYKDPEMKQFLALRGVFSPNDLANIQKAMRVRVEARRQLKLLEKEKIKSGSR